MSHTGKIKVAIIEAGGSHDEVIRSQLLFLEDENIEIHLIIRRLHFEKTGPYNTVHSTLILEKEEKLSDRVKNLRLILRYLADHSIYNVVINTAQGAFTRDLTLMAPRDLRFTGISHNPQKLGHSFTQKLISRRIKKYFVLSDFILENVKDQNPDLALDVFYPVFFPSTPLKSRNSMLNVCIPGAVDPLRRDYKSLLRAAAVALPIKISGSLFLAVASKRKPGSSDTTSNKSYLRHR